MDFYVNAPHLSDWLCFVPYLLHAVGFLGLWELGGTWELSLAGSFRYHSVSSLRIELWTSSHMVEEVL